MQWANEAKSKAVGLCGTMKTVSSQPKLPSFLTVLHTRKTENFYAKILTKIYTSLHAIPPSILSNKCQFFTGIIKFFAIGKIIINIFFNRGHE